MENNMIDGMEPFRLSLQQSLQKFQHLYIRPLYVGIEEDEEKGKQFYQAINIQQRACWGDMIRELESLLRQYALLLESQ